MYPPDDVPPSLEWELLDFLDFWIWDFAVWDLGILEFGMFGILHFSKKRPKSIENLLKNRNKKLNEKL